MDPDAAFLIRAFDSFFYEEKIYFPDYSPRFEIIVLPVRDHSVSSYFKPFSYVPELNSVLKAQNPEPL